ncbi:unnamed protein product [Caenorhabditis angaria]|uniref:Uncharacterized protein n=1 Tax=Caenorhabditis angaria TaxID=860376 RepID=A0A9P1IY38_9PELO|nr:unnamed protein product [Caenorhabditis angaria]
MLFSSDEIQIIETCFIYLLVAIGLVFVFSFLRKMLHREPDEDFLLLINQEGLDDETRDKIITERLDSIFKGSGLV